MIKQTKHNCTELKWNNTEFKIVMDEFIKICKEHNVSPEMLFPDFNYIAKNAKPTPYGDKI